MMFKFPNPTNAKLQMCPVRQPTFSAEGFLAVSVCAVQIVAAHNAGVALMLTLRDSVGDSWLRLRWLLECELLLWLPLRWDTLRLSLLRLLLRLSLLWLSVCDLLAWLRDTWLTLTWLLECDALSLCVPQQHCAVMPA